MLFNCLAKVLSHVSLLYIALNIISCCSNYQHAFTGSEETRARCSVVRRMTKTCIKGVEVAAQNPLNHEGRSGAASPLTRLLMDEGGLRHCPGYRSLGGVMMTLMVVAVIDVTEERW